MRNNCSLLARIDSKSFWQKKSRQQVHSEELASHFDPATSPVETGMERLERKQAALTEWEEPEALLKANEVT
jgi:hypothetical protein